MKVHVVGVGLVDGSVNGDGRALVVVEGEVPSFAAAAASVRPHVGAVVHVERGITVPFGEGQVCLKSNKVNIMIKWNFDEAEELDLYNFIVVWVEIHRVGL